MSFRVLSLDEDPNVAASLSLRQAIRRELHPNADPRHVVVKIVRESDRGWLMREVLEVLVDVAYAELVAKYPGLDRERPEDA